jgi:hypothetical protein
MPLHPPPSLSSSDSDPGVLWESFCDALKEVGQVLRRPETPRDERTLAEAYRYLVRQVRVGFENTHEIADLEHPRLTPMVGPMVQYEGVTSDARYLHALLDGRGTHRIRGTRGGAPLIEFGIYTGKMGLHDPSHLISSKKENELEVGPDGRMEVVLSPDPHPGNWIQTDERTRYMMIRQYAADWSDLEEGHFTIERLDVPDAPTPFGLDEIRRDLERTIAFARDNPPLWAEISDYWAGFCVNRIIPQLDADAKTDIAPPSGHHFACGYFRIDPDRALEIRFRPEGAVFWSFGLANYWYETIGYGRRDSHLNSGTASFEADGSVRLRISLDRPGDADGSLNWVDPRGHREGTMVFRWSRATAPMPEFECVELATDGS